MQVVPAEHDRRGPGISGLGGAGQIIKSREEVPVGTSQHPKHREYRRQPHVTLASAVCARSAGTDATDADILRFVLVVQEADTRKFESTMVSPKAARLIWPVC